MIYLTIGYYYYYYYYFVLFPFVILHHTQTAASRPLHCPAKDNQDSSIPDAKRKHIPHVKALKSKAAANSNQQG